MNAAPPIFSKNHRLTDMMNQYRVKQLRPAYIQPRLEKQYFTEGRNVPHLARSHKV